MPEQKHEKAQCRNDVFSKKTATQIWQENPCEDNPYIAESALCHGYDLYDLMEKCSFSDMFYLLFRGELPDPQTSKLLETLMIALINPGPRHPATRAAMNAGIGKTMPTHIIPIATSILGGDYLGGGEIESAMRFLRRQKNNNPITTATHLLEEHDASDSIAPGFGKRFGGIDVMSHSIVERLLLLEGNKPVLEWSATFASTLNSKSMGWLTTGVAAAVFCDLGFQPKIGGALFQLLGAPGLAAHGLELANKPITAMPFISDENYVIEK
jgi:citrate synthase